MIRQFIALLALIAIAAPAAAQDRPITTAQEARWVHQGSGATFPRTIGNQAIASSQDLNGANDSALVYAGDGSAVESTTVYIFRAAVPDARLWFDRALPIVARDIPVHIFEAGPDEPLTAFGASAPNGMQRIYTTSQQGPFRTTAIAVAQAGEWIVKIRVSSATLDRIGVSAHIAALAGSIRFRDPAVLRPLSARPADCRAESPVRARPVDADEGAIASGLGGLLALATHIRQPLGLGEGWCRDPAMPAELGTLIRRGDSLWIALLGDAGKAVAAVSGAELGLANEERAFVYVATPAYTRGAGLFDGMPSLLEGLQAARPVLTGASEGLFELSRDNGGPERSGGGN